MDNDYKKIVKQTTVEVNISTTQKILARVSVDLQKPPIIIKGFTVREKDNRKYVLPPSFPNFQHSMSPIIWMAKELWELLATKILDEYQKEKATDNLEKHK